MSNKRFWWSVFAVWVVMAATGWLFNTIWLAPWYKDTAQFWRPQHEMMSWMPLMGLGWAAFAWAFVWIWSKGLSQTNVWWQAWRYAWAIIAVSQIPEWTMWWTVSPFPWGLVVRWFAAGALQSLLCAFVMTWTFKPEASWSASAVKR